MQTKSTQIKFVLIVLIVLMSVFSCKKEANVELRDAGYQYFPLDIGKQLIYNIDSINYNDFTGKVDSFNWQLKEIIDSSFTDLEQREIFPIKRYTRLNAANPWIIKDIWSAVKTNLAAERNEENIVYTKLVFPIKNNTAWNYNAKNTQEKLECKYENINKSYKIDDKNFDSTITVVHIDEETLISKDYSIEIYAKNVGLIYKKDVHLEMLLSGVIKKGYDYTQKIKHY